MTKKRILLFVSLFLLIGLTGCASNQNQNKTADAKEDKLLIITTYSIIYDIVRNVGGDRIEIHSLAPVGSNPHEYEPLPLDVQKTTDADAVFYNGLNLEEGNSWFEKLMGTTGKAGAEAPVFRLSKGVEPMYLTTEGKEGEEDPHAWLDIRNGIKYAENARDALIEIDSDYAEEYKKNAESYIKELEALHQKAIERYSEIPKENRVFVTSEGAFKYFSQAYDFTAEYIWEINQENQGTPNQITRILDIIEEQDIQGLFLETSIDPRSMEMVSRETGIEIKGKVFTDSIGKPGEDGDTYLKMMEWNIETILEGLTN
ncbi:zinc ABC transporter substrate-binding protein [Planomicrobium sp. Y74]|uniref:metal ABC transporter solute-binding protein, Zn/Mn family n=1 Tax=Planomicrobium sp. Y74 TaxID=2478977 RepID=UPI000EF44213|nr:zinc ABC transporter substrate-binding protein [Planomicrobium sp. Y74]RLQ84905.1 metal ABC transporter substrate-binding protein [Planomicrobium sp. Y74]